MTYILEFIAVLALIWAGLSIMVGVLPPGEALRRVRVALVVLLVLPCFLFGFIHDTLSPLLGRVVTELESAARILLIAAVVALLAWLVGHLAQRQLGRNHVNKGD